jgi:ABC-type branched-subunit amino acid transport system ATPase component
MDNSQPLLDARGVVKRFGGITAVNGASVDVIAGQIVALIGPNGAGKSTFMRLLTGEERCDEGVIRIKGREVTGSPPYKISRLGLGRTYQEGRLFWSMSVLENLLVSAHPQVGESAFGALFRRRRVRDDEQRLVDRAFEVLSMVGLETKARDLAGALSGGQRRLLEIARLLLTDAEIAVLDEPTAGLAPSMVSVLEDMLKLLAAKGLGVLVVEHHMGLVSRVSDHVRVMTFGQIMAEGTYEEIRSNVAVQEAYLGA